MEQRFGSWLTGFVVRHDRAVVTADRLSPYEDDVWLVREQKSGIQREVRGTALARIEAEHLAAASGRALELMAEADDMIRQLKEQP